MIPLRSLFIFLLLLGLLPIEAFAEDANVLPKGNFSFNTEYKHYLNWHKQYDKDGDVIDAASDYNAELNSYIFPSLGALQPYFPPDVLPNIGTTVTDFDYSYDRIDLTLAYGLTDKLTIGVKIPYIWYKNKVKTSLDVTDANVGKNPAYDPNQPVGPTNPPLIPTSMGGVKMNEEDIQDLLGDGLYINGGLAVPGYGYDRFETWEEQGLGDIEAGLKYRYYQSDKWRLAVLGGVVFPTGKGYDPDKLQAQQLGGGFYSLAFRSYNDFLVNRNLTINGSIFYYLNLPFEDDRRVVRSASEPLSDLVEKVDINPGDVIEVKTSATYQFDEQSPFSGAALRLEYNYTKGFKHDVSGSGPSSSYAGIEDETDGEEQTVIATIAYSTIPLFVKKEFPIPMTLALSYRNKFAGTNGTFKTQYIQAGLNIYF